MVKTAREETWVARTVQLEAVWEEASQEAEWEVLVEAVRPDRNRHRRHRVGGRLFLAEEEIRHRHRRIHIDQAAEEAGDHKEKLSDFADPTAFFAFC